MLHLLLSCWTKTLNIEYLSSQAGGSERGICYCLFPHRPEAQNVDVSVSRDGRRRTSVSAIVALDGKLRTDICYSLSLDERLRRRLKVTVITKWLDVKVVPAKQHRFYRQLDEFLGQT